MQPSADVEKLGINGKNFTFISEAHGSTSWLDHCVVTSAAYNTVTRVEIDKDVYVSDHLPIHIECNLDLLTARSIHTKMFGNAVVWGERDETQTTMYGEICNSKLREIIFPSEFIECAQGSCSIYEHRLTIANLYDRIVNILCEAAVKSSECNKCKRVRRKGKIIGWNKHVRVSHREARLHFNNWVFHNRPRSGVVYDVMCESRKIFKSRLRWCQDNQEQIKMDIIAKQRASKNFKSFWKSTGKLDVKPGLPTNVGGTSDPVEIANLFMNHFKVQSPLGPSVGECDAGPGCQGDLGIIHCSAKKVRQVINKMSRGKSPGHDGLSIEHLKYAGVHLPRVLSLFFSLCMSHAYLPADLMKTVVIPVVKNRTGDISSKMNYRPISLATTIAKVLDSVLDSCLQEHLNLHDAQFGFRPGLSTESAILSLKHTVQYYTGRKTPVVACFLDLSRAFDLVSYDVLWRKLESTGIPAEVLKIFKYWYTNQTNVVRWSNSYSGAYRLECGVRQGGLTSPKLFNLYVHDLIVELSSMRVGCSINGVKINNISYADDMVLLGPTMGGVRDMLKVCEAYAASHGLVYNVKKCEYMVFGVVGKKREFTSGLTLNGLEINKVTQFKYLGHFLTDDLKDNMDIERERRALAVRGNMIARRFARCTDQVKITLFKAFCQGMYTGNLWVAYAKRSLDALRVQYNNIFRMLLRLPRYCSASEMFAKAHTDGFHAIIRKKTTSLMSRVRGSSNSILKTIADNFTSPMWKVFVQRVIHQVSNPH